MSRDTEFIRKKNQAIALLNAAGVRNSEPFLYRLLWRLGVHIPPPLFAPFALEVLLFGLFFALGWGMTMWWMDWQHRGILPLAAVLISLLTGLLFGLAMAGMQWRTKKRKKLPTWKSL
ncbi:DUF6404 family protein [Candidatus Pantoea multigeneris]|uniref:Uncharacterized protein n=1 Tax=Candidatus Pantoea multigeneris TaxID=2608357 RepID=A0ABX0R7X7_9GAMM|nr:DUF6404 family protein [Pantoea multigeneris]NIF21472.1 hypothetical protein [Pantoea multigeneris]